MNEDVRRLLVVLIAFVGIIYSGWLFVQMGKPNVEICKFQEAGKKLDEGIYVVYSGDSSMCSSCVLSLWEELYDFSEHSFLLVTDSVFQSIDSHLNNKLLDNIIVCKKINPDFQNKLLLLDKNRKIQFLSNISLSYGERNKVLKLHIGSFIN